MREVPELRVQMFLDVRRPYRDTSASNQILGRFAHDFRTTEWPWEPRPEIFYDPRSLEVDAKKRASLHAKFGAIDGREVFVSSANFTEAAQLRNIEVGVMLRDEVMTRQLLGYFAELVNRGALFKVPGIDDGGFEGAAR